jgi:4-hydroxy-3-polyprenylbenzoate decarboxylase
VLVLEAPPFPGYARVEAEMEELSRRLAQKDLGGFPLVVLADDPAFTASHLRNFLWVTFTRSNPSHDVHGVSSFTEHKHWGCAGSMIIDARLKPHHAPPLVEDREITKRVDRLAAKGGSLHGVLQ